LITPLFTTSAKNKKKKKIKNKHNVKQYTM